MAGLMLVGCSKQRSIVGEWQTKGEDQVGTLTFEPDGKFKGVAKSSIATLVVDGTYELKDESLRRRIINWQIQDVKTSKDERETMNQALAQPIMAVITWKNDDMFSIRSDNGDFVVARRTSK